MKTYDERIQSVQKKLRRRAVQLRWTAVTAGTLCLCIVAGFAFPFLKNNANTTPDANHVYEETGEYGKVVRALRAYQLNNSEKGDSDDILLGIPEGAPVAPGDPVDGATNGTPDRGDNSSVGITDNQVAGVLEADIIKRSQTHIFYMDDSRLRIYPIAGESTKQLSTWSPSIADESYNSAEMFLNSDATRLYVIARGYGAQFTDSQKESFVRVVSLDISNPASVKNVGNLFIRGSYVSSRMVEDDILVVTNYRINGEVDFEDEATYLPQVGTRDKMESIPGENIIVPEKLTDDNYTVVTLLDSENLEMKDSAAFMSYSSNLYVSAENIYATRRYTEIVEQNVTESRQTPMTEISCISYSKEGLDIKGTFRVEGTVKNQYSMDEYNGIFRVVTTTGGNEILKSSDGTISAKIIPSNANLTCFEVGSWEQVAQVARFAPDGETAESVRFDGNHAYVCTAVVMTLNDPVFFFDLTDLNNITVKDTGTIDGYSTSLIQLKNGYLMGIGYDENRSLKVEIYEETADGVQPVCDYIQSCLFTTVYKAYYIDRENNLFGIPTNGGYKLLKFDGTQLVEVTSAAIWAWDSTRGVVIDGYLYVFGGEKFMVMKVD